MTRRDFAQAAAAGLAALLAPFRAAEPQHAPEAEHVWTTKAGRRVRICDMTDDHLRNTIFYLNKWYGLTFGPVPSAANQHVFLTHTPQDICQLYDVMRREADRRRLRWIT